MFPYPLPKQPGNTVRYLAGALTSWQTYEVPLGAVALSMLLVGAGGAGGAGFSAAAAAARGGGGGGGSGAIARLLIPTAFLPSTLHILVGAGRDAASGGDSHICIEPNTNVPSQITKANAGLAGGVGTGTAAGAGGTLGGLNTVATAGPYNALGVHTNIAGMAGAAGGVQTGAAGVAVSFGINAIFITSGAGGAGTTSADFAGGGITGGGKIPSLPGGLAGSNPGVGGFGLWLPPSFCGGTGGGASNTGVGGAGGPGNLGSGGGGGGGGTTGGAGGKGGNGFIMITAIY